MNNTDQRHPLAEQFLGWQCLIRQHCMRQHGGRPLQGMQPVVGIAGQDVGVELNVLLLRKERYTLIEQFKHMVRSQADPNERYDKAVQMFQADYYQKPGEFEAGMTALFSLDSQWGDRLSHGETCVMLFEQSNQSYRLTASVIPLPESDDRYQITYWHNYLFNEKLPGKVRVLLFQPDWEVSTCSGNA